MKRPFDLCPRQRENLPPIQRLAAGGGFTLKVSVDGGRLRRAGDCRRPAAGVPVFTGGVRRAHGEGQKGARAPNGSLAPS